MDILKYTESDLIVEDDDTWSINCELFGRTITLYGKKKSELLALANEYARCLIASHNRKMATRDEEKTPARAIKSS